MLARTFSFGLFGIEAYPVEIEVDISRGLPAVTLVGLADTAIKESKERVRSAIKNSGFDWPAERITINLAPSNLKKEGAGFDLAIALGILAATEQLNCALLENYYILAELSLDGSLRPASGVLPACMKIAELSKKLSADKRKEFIIPLQNTKEAAAVCGVNVFALKTLREAVEFLHDPNIIKPVKIDSEEIFQQEANYPLDFSEVKGQYLARRAIEVAVAGGHNIILIGPAGSGKTMLAKRIPTIMPRLSLQETLEVTQIYSAMGLLNEPDGIVKKRPLRSPHHTISDVALAGGGSWPRPGEISLAHQGVLFLDELPEFQRNCLETLRQPLEDGYIRVSRISKSLVFPASFILVCAMNPCPCGNLGQNKIPCRCSTTQVAKYRSKISGPLLDRIDIHIAVPAARYHELSADIAAESSAQIKKRVEEARAIQIKNFSGEGIFYNAKMNHKQLRKFCVLGKEENDLLKAAMTKLNFSARAYDKILKVSRTIADLAGSEQIRAEHLAEAIQYRSLDRNFFI